tara:strand:- start:163 stop:543 length:381 start_codon:yes stop_codon:yes gene_type:complete
MDMPNYTEESKDYNPEEHQVKKSENGRDAKGRLLPGHTANPNGRPKKGKSTAEQFRSNPKALDILNKVIQIASTLGSEDEHKDATSCAKVVVDKIIPTLKAQDISIESDSVTGFVVLPKEEESVKE